MDADRERKERRREGGIKKDGKRERERRTEGEIKKEGKR